MRFWAGLLSIAALTQGGCAAINGSPHDPINNRADTAVLAREYGSLAIEQYMAARSADRQMLRNRIAYGRMGAYDGAFDDFQRQLTSENHLVNLGGIAGGVGLATAGTLAKHAATKTNLAAYALALTGLRSESSKELFYEKTLPAVITQMQANRLKIRVVIEQGLTKADSEYPLEAALLDLQTYREAGSVAAAISSLGKAAEEQKANATQDISDIREVAFVKDDATLRLIDWLYPNDPSHKVTDAARRDKFQAALDGLQLGDVPLPTILYGKSSRMAAARASLVADPTLKIP